MLVQLPAAYPLCEGRAGVSQGARAKYNMSPEEALAFVERHGVVLQAARGSVPSLAEAIAGGRIRGSWWGHPQAREIFRVAQAICESPDILVCKFVEGKITYIHRRLWPALVKLASHFGKEGLARVWDEHTRTGAHRSRQIAFPAWVPGAVIKQAERLSRTEAEAILLRWLSLGARAAKGDGRRKRRASR
jgi:hypothetical protein